MIKFNMEEFSTRCVKIESCCLADYDMPPIIYFSKEELLRWWPIFVGGSRSWAASTACCPGSCRCPRSRGASTWEQSGTNKVCYFTLNSFKKIFSINFANRLFSCLCRTDDLRQNLWFPGIVQLYKKIKSLPPDCWAFRSSVPTRSRWWWWSGKSGCECTRLGSTENKNRLDLSASVKRRTLHYNLYILYNLISQFKKNRWLKSFMTLIWHFLLASVYTRFARQPQPMPWSG